MSKRKTWWWRRSISHNQEELEICSKMKCILELMCHLTMTVDLKTKTVIPWQLLQQGRGAYLDANYTRSQTDDHFTSSSFSLNSSQCMTRVLPQAIGYESCSESLAGAILLYIVGCFVGCLVGWLVVWLDGWWADGINGGLAGRLVSEWILWKPTQFNF